MKTKGKKKTKPRNSYKAARCIDEKNANKGFGQKWQ